MSFTCRLVLLCDVSVTAQFPVASGGWQPGPFVESYVDHKGRAVQTDASTRATNFPTTLATRLYGSSTDHDLGVRYSCAMNTSWNDGTFEEGAEITVTRAEFLAMQLDSATQGRRRPGVLALHLEIVADDFDAAVAIADSLSRQRGEQGESAVHGSRTYERLRTLHSAMVAGLRLPTDNEPEIDSESSIYSLMFIDQAAIEIADAVVEPSGLSFAHAYSAASGQAVDAMWASAESLNRARALTLELSRDWSATFVRHGAAFVAHAQPGSDYAQFMPLFFGTLYADAVMLARLHVLLVRRSELAAHDLLERAAGQPYLGAVAEDFAALDRELAINSARYWMGHSESSAGNAVKVLHAAQRSMGFDARLAALDAQVERLGRLASADSQERAAAAQNRLTTVVAIMGSIALPVTFAKDIFQVLELPPTPLTIVVLMVVIAVIALVTWWCLRKVLHGKS